MHLSIGFLFFGFGFGSDIPSFYVFSMYSFGSVSAVLCIILSGLVGLFEGLLENEIA